MISSIPLIASILCYCWTLRVSRSTSHLCCSSAMENLPMEQSSLLKDLEICAVGKNSSVVSHPHRRILRQGLYHAEAYTPEGNPGRCWWSGMLQDIHQPSVTLHSFLYSLSVVEIGPTSSSVPKGILLLSCVVLGPKIMCPN